MPCWYYEKKDLRNTPSFQIGIDPDVEARYRREGARFIINTGTKMGLRYDTMATGVVYFHRFYMFHTFKDFPRYVTACCCLFLAGKVEETPKKCKDIIKTARSLLTDHQFAQFGEDPKEEVMTLERILLQTIKFDLQVDHPYGYLLKYAKCLKGDKQKLQKMVQMAWTFVNDSLCTSLCLQWEPEIIAIALMYLAGKLSKFEVNDWSGRQPKHARWWDMYVEDISMELLEDICHQVLDLYSSHPTGTRSASPPVTPPAQVSARTGPQTPTVIPTASLPTPVVISRSNSPSQPPPSVASTQAVKAKQEHPGPKTPSAMDHKPVHSAVVAKTHPVAQTIPVVTETTFAHGHAASAAGYYPPETFTQYSSPAAPPPSVYPPVPPPSYVGTYTPAEPAPYDASAAPAVPYTQQQQSQHYPASYDAQAYANYPSTAQQYYPAQASYHAQPGQATGYPQPVTQYEETAYGAALAPQYAATAAAAVSTYTSAAAHVGYAPQAVAYPVPGSYAAPRAGHPQVVPKHGPTAAAGNIAPVRITGRNNRQSWNI